MFFLFNCIQVFVAVILHTTLMNYFSLWDIKPDIILIIVVYAGLVGGKKRGILVGAFAGFVQDNLSTGILGLNTLVKGLIGYLIGSVKHKVLSENTISQSFFIFFSSIGNVLFSFIIISTVFIEIDITNSGSYLTHMLLQSLYNAILGHIIFFYLYKLEKKLFRTHNKRYLQN